MKKTVCFIFLVLSLCLCGNSSGVYAQEVFTVNVKAWVVENGAQCVFTITSTKRETYSVTIEKKYEKVTVTVSGVFAREICFLKRDGQLYAVWHVPSKKTVEYNPTLKELNWSPVYQEAPATAEAEKLYDAAESCITEIETHKIARHSEGFENFFQQVTVLYSMAPLKDGAVTEHPLQSREVLK